MSSGKTRQITWPRLCHPFRSDDFRIHSHYNQFSSYLLRQPLLFLSQSEGLHHNSPRLLQAVPSQIRRDNRQKVHKNGLRLAISILATDTTCKLYVLSAPTSTVLFFTLLYSGFVSNRRQSQRLLLSRSTVAMPA